MAAAHTAASLRGYKQANSPAADLREPERRGPRAQGGDVSQGRVRDLPEGGLSSGVLWRHADWFATAQPNLHAELCEYAGAGKGVDCVQCRSGLEEALGIAALCL